jgi:hypothetical protein
VVCKNLRFAIDFLDVKLAGSCQRDDWQLLAKLTQLWVWGILQ